jgi:hypothetical protein
MAGVAGTWNPTHAPSAAVVSAANGATLTVVSIAPPVAVAVYAGSFRSTAFSRLDYYGQVRTLRS